MIRKLFLPNEIRGYYIFPQRIIGIDIGKTHVHAAQVLLKGTKVVIEKYFDQAIEPGTNNNYHERTVNALKAVFSRVDRYQEVRTSMSSAGVIFKKMTLPFESSEQIALVVGFELEGLLPFPLEQTAYDFIITKKNPEEKSSEVLVAAVQRTLVDEHLSLFADAGIKPTAVTVDIVQLSGVYQRIPAYALNN